MKQISTLSLFLYCLLCMATLVTSQNLQDSVTVINNSLSPKKKERNREIYFGWYQPFFNANTQSTRSGLIFTEIGEDSTYYSYQSYRSHHVKLKGTRGISFGYNKSRKLFGKINYKTGLGINAFRVKYDKSFTEDSIRIINKYKRINSGPGASIEIIEVNEYLTNFNTQSTILGSPYNFYVASLQIPLALEIMISPILTCWGGVNYNFVFEGSVYSSLRNNGNTTYSYEETQRISRLYATIDLHLKYNFYKNFFLDVNGAYVGGVFNYHPGLSANFFDGIKNIRGYNFGARVGYNF